MDGIVMSWNPAAERMFGYTAAEMLGQSIRRIMPPERQAEEDFVLAQVRAGHEVQHFDTVRQRRDGSQVAISLTLSPIRDDDGRIIGASKIARDISDRQRIEAERMALLRASEENAAAMRRLNTVGTTVASTLDRAAVLQAVSDAATELTGAQFGAYLHNSTDNGGESYQRFTLSGVSRAAFAGLPLPINTAVFGPSFGGQRIVRSSDITREAAYVL